MNYIKKYILFTDSDIVFEKNPLNYLLENIEDYDILIQQNMSNLFIL